MANQVIFCPNCGLDNPTDSVRCSERGQSFTGEAGSASVPTDGTSASTAPAVMRRYVDAHAVASNGRTEGSPLAPD